VKQIKNSPIENRVLKPHMVCKDYTVSQDSFTLLIDKESGLLVTSPRPEDKDLAAYYESDMYISHTDANKSIIDKLYQLVKNYSLKQKLKRINSFPKPEKKLLDIGAGTGDFLSICEANKWNVVGVEPSVKARTIAKQKLQNNTSKIYTTIEELLSKSETFDVITMWHVLEHVPNLNAYITFLKRLLKPNGTLVIAVPNHKSYDAEYYKEFWAAYDVPRHLWHFSKRSISNLFQQEEMTVVKILPMKFDAYYVSLLSEKYKTGSSNYLKAFYIGLRSNSKASRSKEYSSLTYILKKV